MHLQLDHRPPCADVTADGLALRFAATPGLAVVAVLEAPLQGSLVARVEVLAASHRIRLVAAGAVVATEQVACTGEPSAPALPAAADHRADGHRLEFRSERTAVDGDDLTRLATRLRARAGPSSLVVTFPGHHDALTAVRVGPNGWETWHLYPGAAPQAVRTRTTVVAT